MTRRIAIVMDPINSLNIAKDSTLALLESALARGWQVLVMQMQDIYLKDKIVLGDMKPIHLALDQPQWYELEETQSIPLKDCDAVLLRKDPPFDHDYLTLTYLLECAEQQGASIFNRPGSVRDANEKLFALQFIEWMPPALVSADIDKLTDFAQDRAVVYKPLYGMGGDQVYLGRSEDPNLSTIIENLSNHGHTTIMAQQFVEDVLTGGDKRILIINGEPYPYALARVPVKGSIRANLATGGSGMGVELTERDKMIAKQVGSKCREKGLIFVGIDVIGRYLTEVNVTCPTCIRQLDHLYEDKIADKVLDAIFLR